MHKCRSAAEEDEEPSRLLRLKIKAGHNLAKKDIFGASDPYVRVDLLSSDKDTVIDTFCTRTKKRFHLGEVLCSLSSNQENKDASKKACSKIQDIIQTGRYALDPMLDLQVSI
ncbi:e3 ubiquitin-protein ligase [Trichonephila clavipes]|nr:e3 ubiquitin-protein ligase [Trichonephila clavipes]